MILVGSFGYFGWGLADEPHFVDESAYIAQSFYGDLYWSGRWNHPAWLDYAGYDLPPLPKYLISFSLWANGYRRPTLADTHAWYRNTSRQFVPLPGLVAARRPSVWLGAVGCVALFWLGTLTLNARVGGLAAVLLMINPLYFLHARRAMSDVPAECFMLLALMVGVVIWQRAGRARFTIGWWGLVVLAGIWVGLATLSKLNGVLSGLVLGAWAGLGMVRPGTSPRTRVALGGSGILAASVAFVTFVVLNPFLLAQPTPPVAAAIADEARLSFPGRVRAVYDHRATVSRVAMKSFPNDALPTLADRVAVMVVQGFGRFGPFGARERSDSTQRFAWRFDWGAVVWFPLVALGALYLLVRGVRQNQAQAEPQAWLVLAYFGVVMVVVTGFIPLAWDRYLMSIQPAAALVGAALLVAVADRVGQWVRGGEASS